MSKLNFILLFLILIQNTLSQSNSTDTGEIIYGYLKDFYAGMSDDEENSKCLKVITDKKAYLIENLKPIIESIGDANMLFKNLLTFGVNILTMHGFAKNCKILNVIIFYNKLTIKEEILNFSINETEKSTNTKKTDETPETNEPKHSSEDNKNTNNNQFEKNKNPREANEQQNLSGNNSQQRQSPEEIEENLHKKKEKLFVDMINKKKKLLELDNNISNINKNRMEKKSKIIELEKELNLQELELENQKIQKEKEENDLKNISEEIKEIKSELNFISLKKSILMELSINKNENLLGKKRNDNNEDE